MDKEKTTHENVCSIFSPKKITDKYAKAWWFVFSPIPFFSLASCSMFSAPFFYAWNVWRLHYCCLWKASGQILAASWIYFQRKNWSYFNPCICMPLLFTKILSIASSIFRMAMGHTDYVNKSNHINEQNARTCNANTQTQSHIHTETYTKNAIIFYAMLLIVKTVKSRKS